MTKRKVIVSGNVNFLDENMSNRSTEPVDMDDVQQEVSHDDHIDFGMMEEVDDSGEELDDELVEEPEDLEDKSVGEPEELEEEIQVNAPRRSTSQNLGVKPVKLEDYVLLAKIEDPTSFSEAMSSPQREKWIKAMEEELSSICDNNTWDLVDLPKDKKAIGSKWVFKVKYDQDGTVQRYKARLVAQGFDERY